MESNPDRKLSSGMHEAPLTSAQRSIANTIGQGADATLAWNEVRVIRLRGELIAEALLATLADLVERHDALRACVRDGVMTTGAVDAASIRIDDLAELTAATRGERLDQTIRALVTEPFELGSGPLFRAVLVRLAPNEHVLCLAAHHVVCDGWSFGTLIEELVQIYRGKAPGAGAAPALEPTPSFVQFARDEIAGRFADQRQTDLAYWQSVFADVWPTLDLPIDHPRGARRTFTSQRQELRLDADLVARLKLASGRQGASLFSILCAAYAGLVARLSGSSDVVIAVPAAAQLNEGLDRLVGQCVSHLPLRLAVDMDASAGQLLAATQRAVLDAYEHMSCGLESLLERFDPAAGQGGLALASVKFNLNPSLDAAVAGLDGLQCDVHTPARVAEHFEMFLNAEQDAQGVLLCCQHNSDLFDASTVQRWLSLYRQVLEGMSADLEQVLAALLTPIPEEAALLAQFNSNRAPLDRAMRIEAMIDAQVLRTPQAIAVSAGDEHVSFAELQRRAYGVTVELQRRGVRAGDLVGLSCGRNELMLIGLYGILKAGAGYVPLDPSFPIDRLDFMAEDAALKLVLCDESVRGGWAPNCEVLMLDEVSPASECAAAEGAHSEMPAYVIYTSGSTGKPKGVRVPHRSAVNLLKSVAKEPGMGTRDVVLAVTTLSFDIAVSEVILPMTVGARIVVADRDETTDGNALRALVERQHVNFIDATPSTWRLLLAAGWPGNLALTAICTGEPLPPDLAAELLPRVAVLWNGYGPTETTVWSSFHKVTSPTVPIPIGKPVLNTQFHVLDPKMRPLPLGVTGELWIGGDGVTLGYLNRPDLTAERFIDDPFSTEPGARLYKAGDLGRWRLDGVLECLGRADHQVKVRGYRIELGEIEVQLCAHADVARAVVITREDRPGDVRLVAYVVPHHAMPAATQLREHLAQQLPDYMIPQHFVPMVQIPLLPNGKINRHALPQPSGARPELSVPYQSPVGDLEAGCCEVFAAVLGLDQVGRHDNFFELGGNSLLAMRVLDGLAKLTGQTLTAPTIFAHPDPASLAVCLAPKAPAAPAQGFAPAAKRAGRTQAADDPIAVIGMAGRFPGARSVDALWANLVAGRDSITQFTLDTLDPSIPHALRSDPNYVKARGIVDDVEAFDNAFFGISAREAEIMDPQHRVFLEIAWECLERAGYAPDQIEAAVGVFAGVYTPSYLQRHVLAHPEAIERIGEFQVMVGNDKDYVATRVAHKLNLKGPAIAVHTACSTSLVAIAQAVDSLRLGRCDMALAGAASVTSPPRSGYLYQEGAMLSKDGHTRTFDADATGTAFNDGAAVVLLKRLSDAVADGDQIFAVIRGVATNNDGGGKASFTAPSVQGQAAVVAAAHDDAGVDPRSISYIEAHGTATPLGDPVEVEALTRAFRRGTSDTGFCRIGSAKSNIGHLVTAAGATGLIKTALALATEQLPPTIHFDKPNPKIDFANSPFIVNDRLTPWPRGTQPRRAGVSSFGVGGTNAHAVLEEAPLAVPSPAAVGPQLIQLSAKTRAALDTMATQLADHLEAHPELNLADVAHTLRVGRSPFAHRLAVVGSSGAQIAAALRSSDDPLRAVRALGAAVPPLVWLFPGQGAQYAGMGRELYAHDAAFRAAFDECLEALHGALAFDLKVRMFDGGAESLMATGTTQPATFALEYALAKTWLARGAKPAALVGHSVGEFVAAVLAGVMPLADAARLVARRGEMMQALPGGSMLSVRLSLDKLQPMLPAGLSLAAENGPTACVVAGPTDAIEAWAKALEADGMVARLLQTSHAFHSSMMDAAVAPFEAEVRKVRLAAPQLPIISTLTGALLSAADATDPNYWARHLREPVRFSPALRTALARQANAAFLEIGPRGTLSTLARQHAAAGKGVPVAVPSLGDAPGLEVAQLALAQGQLWTLGVQLSDSGAGGDARAGGRRRVQLPSYPFERKRFWLEATQAQPVAESVAHTAAHSYRAAQPAPAPVALQPLPVAASPHPSLVNPPAAAAANPAPVMPMPSPTAPSVPATAGSRQPQLVARLREVFEDVAGTDLSDGDPSTSFVELGLDSLTLTQAALQVKKQFSVALTFRQLMEKYRSFDALAQFLDASLPPDPVAATTAAPAATTAATIVAPAAAAAAQPAAMPATAAPMMALAPMAAVNGDGSFMQQLIAQQMQLMSQQLALLSGAPVAAALPAVAAVSATTQPAAAVAVPAASATATGAASSAAVPAAVASTAAATISTPAADETGPVRYDVKKAFGAIARIHTQGAAMTDRQRARLDAFVRRYTGRTAKSKAFTAEHRPHMADPRVVNGFRPMVKEIVYQIVIDRTKGSRMWDIDGNEYVDALNGFGMSMLGWRPDFIQDAVRKQLDEGYEIGPQHPLAGDVSRLLCELTGFDRAGLCNTGSEAVMATLRIARTVTGRSTVVVFTGSYHGTFDEVLVRAGRNHKGISAAPGVMSGMFGDIRVLDYGTPESLDYIRQHADELAAVLVEPVQSRRPDFQPREFLREVRAITEKSNTCLIFDEVITGFRSHLGGAQAIFGVRADLASYGKVIGGGFPVGAVCGKREYMDALDGGAWQYGDDSMPTVGVTYFAGTFVRHPLALAAAKASLEYFKAQGNELQTQLNTSTAAMADELSAFCREVGAPLAIRHFASLWRVSWLEDHPMQDLLFPMMRSRGVHILDNFPCFLTTAHTPADIARIKSAFKESIAELQEAEFLPRRVEAPALPDASRPPVPNAKLGRDKDGRPAWFVPDANAPGKYVKVTA
jgi:amino acid adenylation domain-containing protein